ncbi:MAG: glycosyltransferase [Methylotenera sp.]|uniref:glycosyltransferase family 2 protein n=1 Tax=Methylotenera sp. TaxID=2051956 RepID=UPI002489164B|nr:glycosyltransferase [Methylotenera sp.]MDI1309669.1 glycosyltransferase [Methylotenera sp.]
MLVSIYMPTKNRLDMLKAAVESVRNQTYENFELIVVDEASTDGTTEYLKHISEVDSRVRFFRNEVSMGACYARNLAIKASSGVFVTGLDDDDEFKSNHISALVGYWNFLSQNSTDQIACIYCQYISRNGARLKESQKLSNIEYTDLHRVNYIGNQIFAPRHHFIEAGLFDEQMPAWQDLECFYRVLKKFGTARLLDMATYVFDTTPRTDRLSVGQKTRISKACELMIKLHVPNDARAQQRLNLQVYSTYYGFAPTFKEVVDFVRRGFWFEGYLIIFLHYTHKSILRPLKKLIKKLLLIK